MNHTINTLITMNKYFPPDYPENVHFGTFPAMNQKHGMISRDEQSVVKTEIPMSKACADGMFGLVKNLIEKGNDIDQEDELGKTPIIYAAENGYKNIIRLLVNHGAKINYKLFCVIKTKIESMKKDVMDGKSYPHEVMVWQKFLDFLIDEGKRQP
jgi:ankyrin repeat protein